MDKRTVLEAIKQFKTNLDAQHITTECIVLFGSYTNGTNQEGSDIDVVVVSNDFEYKSLFDRMKILSHAIYQVFEPIEAIPMTIKEWEDEESILASIAKKGEIVYQAAHKYTKTFL